LGVWAKIAYHFTTRPCRPGRGNEKGRVERTIQYVRQSFFAARPFTTLEDFNRQALAWREQIAHQRPWPGDDSRTVADVALYLNRRQRSHAIDDLNAVIIAHKS